MYLLRKRYVGLKQLLWARFSAYTSAHLLYVVVYVHAIYDCKRKDSAPVCKMQSCVQSTGRYPFLCTLLQNIKQVIVDALNKLRLAQWMGSSHCVWRVFNVQVNIHDSK